MVTNRTATPQNPQQKAIKSARTKALAAAKRSLKLIEDAVAEHRKALDSSEVPENEFAVYALKYAQALAELRLLGKLAEGEPIEPETAPAAPAPARPEDAAAEAQRRADVAALIEVLGVLAPELQPVEGYPLYRLREFAVPGGAGPANGSQDVQPQQVTVTPEGEVDATLAGYYDQPQQVPAP